MNWLARLLAPFPDSSITPIEDEQIELPVTTPGALDEHSQTWAAVEHWAVTQLQKAREDNDTVANDEIRTAALRGRIKLLKELIELPLPPKRERKRPRPLVEDIEY